MWKCYTFLQLIACSYFDRTKGEPRYHRVNDYIRSIYYLSFNLNTIYEKLIFNISGNMLYYLRRVILFTSLLLHPLAWCLQQDRIYFLFESVLIFCSQVELFFTSFAFRKDLNLAVQCKASVKKSITTKRNPMTSTVRISLKSLIQILLSYQWQDIALDLFDISLQLQLQHLEETELQWHKNMFSVSYEWTSFISLSIWPINAYPAQSCNRNSHLIYYYLHILHCHMIFISKKKSCHALPYLSTTV